ncbi:hypothetical protein N7539_007987 [Penicillium diatomitis]|uniref:Uncharacterized protein n=1 Tax=Penicillium diatomitis TaxID=2819901 RepID=A0A9W9WUF8_9EURO|nr:uncharacterized protein N7539_007987 [Penicillium diatomitis]KAJ5475700.1 hypothetical protein N7539_007987 [Penicillium diatomitis]
MLSCHPLRSQSSPVRHPNDDRAMIHPLSRIVFQSREKWRCFRRSDAAPRPTPGWTTKAPEPLIGHHSRRDCGYRASSTRSRDLRCRPAAAAGLHPVPLASLPSAGLDEIRSRADGETPDGARPQGGSFCSSHSS